MSMIVGMTLCEWEELMDGTLFDPLPQQRCAMGIIVQQLL